MVKIHFGGTRSTGGRAMLWLSALAMLSLINGDKHSIVPVHTKVKAGSYTVGDREEMESSGFVDLSRLVFIPKRNNNRDETMIEVAIFAESSHTNYTGLTAEDEGVNFEPSGIGTSEGKLCCDQDAVNDGICTSDNMNKLNIHKESFRGVVFPVTIPESTKTKGINITVTIDPEKNDPLLFLDGKGSYVMLFANCDSNASSTILIQGDTFWEAYLTDADVEGTAPLYALLTLCYIALLVWFGYRMHQNQESRVNIEVYILGTIILGCLETFFETIDYALYSKHSKFLEILVIFFDTCKSGISRSVLMMVALGWGVTVPVLELRTQIFVFILGALYMLLSFVLDIARLGLAPTVVQADDDDLSNFSETIHFDGLVLLVLDFFIWCWVFMSIQTTLRTLEANNQTRKLERYNWLLRIIIIVIAMNLLAETLVINQIVSDGDADVALLSEAGDVGFFAILACIAYLWRPNPNALEYAYAEQLPSSDDGVYELELTESDKPQQNPDGEDGAQGEGGERTRPVIT